MSASEWTFVNQLCTAIEHTMFHRLPLSILIALSFVLGLRADDNPNVNTNQPSYPPVMAASKVEVYKTIGDTELNLYIFNPKTHELNESRPTIVFFFGGGWKGGSPVQFKEHCRHFASRGMVAIAADYRVRSRHGTTADLCVEDAKSAIRWVRENSRRLGVDRDRIVAGGGSAGGHLAACCAVIQGFEAPNENLKVSSKPNGLALFNPALVLAPVADVHEIKEEKQAELRERMAGDPIRLSPFHQLQYKLPPTIIFHGKADTTVPYRSVDFFAKAAEKLGTPVELHGYEGAGHGFFNVARDSSKHYLDTTLRLDQFLVNHGLLEGPSPRHIETSE